jgi:hypothetical protein
MIGFILFSLMLVFSLYILFDRYYRLPNFFRALMLTKEGNYRLIWLRKTGKMEGKYHVATKGKKTFQYLDPDVIRVGKYDGLFVKEDSTHALRINTDHTKFLDKQSINAESMKEILETKLISELIEPKVSIKDIIMIIGIFLLIAGIAIVFFKVNQMGGRIGEIYTILADMKQIMIQEGTTQVIRPK